MKTPIFASCAALFLNFAFEAAAETQESPINSNVAEAKTAADFESLSCEERWDLLLAKNPVGLKLTYKRTYSTVRDGEPVRFESFFDRTVTAATDNEISYLAPGEPSWFVTVYTNEAFLADCQLSNVKQSVTIEAAEKTTNIVPGLQSFVAPGTFDSMLIEETYRRDQGFSSTTTLIAQDGSGWTLKTVHETRNYSPEPDHISEIELVKVQYPSGSRPYF